MRPGAVAALGVLVVGLGASHASAQQVEGARGWLGVGVQELMQCRVPSAGEDACWKRLVVSQVVVDGPADRAGVQPGDTILALNGEQLEKGISDEAFQHVKRGTVVRLEVGRGGRRSTLRVVPGEWPTGGTVAVRVPIAPGEVSVVQRPLAAPPLPTMQEGRLSPRILIRAEGGGLYQIEPQVEIRLAGPEGEAVRLQLDARETSEPGRQTRATLGRRLRAYADADAEGAAEVWNRYVQLYPGPELRALQDSVFRLARVRLDSLQRTLLRDERQYRTLVDRVRRDASGQFAWSASFGRSVAGAEFQPLSPELAEFFQGAGEGLLCLRVIEETPAHRLGLRPGDVVIEAAGRAVASLDDLRASFRSADGRRIELKWVRKGRPMRGTLRY